MSRREGYHKYISSSPIWAEKREARLKIDGKKCRTCHHDGSQHQLKFIRFMLTSVMRMWRMI